MAETGAAPQPLNGLCWHDNYVKSLPTVVNICDVLWLAPAYIKIIASGKLLCRQGGWALSAAPDFGWRTMDSFFAGCIQALQCNKNTCPNWITDNTNPDLTAGLSGAERNWKRVAIRGRAMHGIGMMHHSVVCKEPRETDSILMFVLLKIKVVSNLFCRHKSRPNDEPEFINRTEFPRSGDHGRSFAVKILWR